MSIYLPIDLVGKKSYKNLLLKYVHGPLLLKTTYLMIHNVGNIFSCRNIDLDGTKSDKNLLLKNLLAVQY